MLELHGWLTIWPTYMDEDKHPEIDEKRIYEEVENIIASMETKSIERVKWRNGTCHLEVSYFSNHKDSGSEEILKTLEKIAQVATGSYGLLYYWDDDNYSYNDFENEFRVLVIKRGTCEWRADPFLSPCIPVIEDAWEG
ncbi:MAG: hypothetical protein IJ379_04955 [Lachnospiraceae bacterium]|nr:hypothetical protein [Lachnospiraceae bacterium]